MKIDVRIIKDGQLIEDLTRDETARMSVKRNYYILAKGEMEEILIGNKRILLNYDGYNDVVRQLLPRPYTFESRYIKGRDMTIYIIDPDYKLHDEDSAFYFPIVDYMMGEMDKEEQDADAELIYNRVMKERRNANK